MKRNSLIEYMSRRMNDPEHKASEKEEEDEGPVVTISREAGCPGKKVSNILKETLDSILIRNQWSVISKEILANSAEELNLHPDRVRKIIDADQRNSLDEILAAFGQHQYKNDKKIRKTVMEVVRSFAVQGYCIILGRGGNIIASDVKRSLHIRLYAPLEWRVKRIEDQGNLSREDALAYINRTEKERSNYRKMIKGSAEDGNEDFDILINCSRIGSHKIVSMIIRLMIAKGLIPRADLKELPGA